MRLNLPQDIIAQSVFTKVTAWAAYFIRADDEPCFPINSCQSLGCDDVDIMPVWVRRKIMTVTYARNDIEKMMRP